MLYVSICSCRKLIGLQTDLGQPDRRPLFFICHGTGGLVATAAIVRASRSRSRQSILTSCHGIAFLSTPHYGSTYLSSPEYAKAIQHLMKLSRPIPQSLQGHFRPRDDELAYLSTRFKSISSDMRIWTFLETVDSTIYAEGPESGNGVEFHVPITSVRSGILGLEHEKEIPLATDHSGTATFKDQEYSKSVFLRELASAAVKALDLSQKPDFPVDVESKDVMIQVNGFFEDTALGVSDASPLKLWSTRISLREYLEKGAVECLKLRMQNTWIQINSDDDSSLSSLDGPPIQSLSIPNTQKEADLKRSRSQLNMKVFRWMSGRDRPKSPSSTSQVPRTEVMNRDDEEAQYIQNPRLSGLVTSTNGVVYTR